MKRKVIQIAGSTQLVSLPRQWAKAHNIQRGQEIEVQEDGDRIVVSANNLPKSEEATFNISGLGEMVARCVSAFYKRGVDTLKLEYDDPSAIAVVHEALAKDTVGFEVLEQTENACLIKDLAGNPQEFESVLHRIFMVLNTMSDECVAAFKRESYKNLKNLAFLEETNNRFTTICMRYLNKNGAAAIQNFNRAGPLYFIVEETEHLADEYKYICQHFANLENTNLKLRKEVLGVFEMANSLIKVYFDVFFKFDKEKIVYLKQQRNKIVEIAHELFMKKMNYAECWLVHHSITLAQRIFTMVDPYLVLKFGAYTSYK